MPDDFRGTTPIKPLMPDMNYRDPWAKYDEDPWSFSKPEGTVSPGMDAFGGIVKSPLYDSIRQYNPFNVILPAISQAFGWDKQHQQRMDEINQRLKHELAMIWRGDEMPDQQLSAMPVMPSSGDFAPPMATAQAPRLQASPLNYTQQPQKQDASALLQQLLPGHFQPQMQNGLNSDQWLELLNGGDIWGTGGRQR